MRAWTAAAEGGAPNMRGAHRLADLLKLILNEGDGLALVRAAPVVGQPRRRQAPGIVHVRIEVDHVIRISQILGFRVEHEMARVVFRKEIVVRRAPPWSAVRRIEAE